MNIRTKMRNQHIARPFKHENMLTFCDLCLSNFYIHIVAGLISQLWNIVRRRN